MAGVGPKIVLFCFGFFSSLNPQSRNMFPLRRRCRPCLAVAISLGPTPLISSHTHRGRVNTWGVASATAPAALRGLWSPLLWGRPWAATQITGPTHGKSRHYTEGEVRIRGDLKIHCSSSVRIIAFLKILVSLTVCHSLSCKTGCHFLLISLGLFANYYTSGSFVLCLVMSKTTQRLYW